MKPDYAEGVTIYRINSKSEFDRVKLETGLLCQNQGLVQELASIRQGRNRRKSSMALAENEYGKYLKATIKNQRHFEKMMGRLPIPHVFLLLAALILFAGSSYATLAILERVLFLNINDGLLATMSESQFLGGLTVKTYGAASWILQASLVNA